MNDIKYNIAETDEYAKLVEFMIANQLEFTKEDAEEVPTDLVKCWEITDSAGNLIGGFVLAKRQGEYICDGIAVDGSRRGENLGTELLNKGIEETKSLGGRSMYLVARAPEFFRKNGFVTIPREEAPNFFECLTCPQYGKTCHPEVMKIEF